MRSLLKAIWRGGRGDDAPPADPARAPEGWCVYAVGDIHGELALLQRLLALIEEDAARLRDAEGVSPVIVFLGDYVDRGPDSRGVLDLLREMKARAGKGAGVACHFLRGNHEAALLEFLRDPVKASDWLRFGGVETLASYGVRVSAGTFEPARCRAVAETFAAKFDPLHRIFIEELGSIIELGDYAFVHAGVRPGVALGDQTGEDLFWIREPFLSSRKFHGRVIVHGHTVVPRVSILTNRIAVDTGAYATGCLSAVALCCAQQRVIQTPPWRLSP